MTRRISDDKLTLGCGKIPVGHIDGYALLTLGFEPVKEQGQIRRLIVPDQLLQRSQLVLIDVLGIRQQPSNERRLPVVDTTCRTESKELFIFVLLEKCFNISHGWN